MSSCKPGTGMIFNFLQAKDRRELNYSKLHAVAISLLSSADTENTFTRLQRCAPSPFFSFFAPGEAQILKRPLDQCTNIPLFQGLR